MPRPLGQPKESHGKDWVALVLAVGLASAVNMLTFGVLYDAIFSRESGLSENATQILVAAFGGIIGVLGGYIGYRAGERNQRIAQEEADEDAEGGGRGRHAPPSGPPSQPSTGGGVPDG